MNSVALINPPDSSYHDNIAIKSRFDQPAQHLGIAYIAAYLEQDGIGTDLFDCPVENISMTDIKEIILSGKYNFVGITAFEHNYYNALRIAKYIKKTNPNCFVWLGGYQATFEYQEFLIYNSYIDCCEIGEGEVITKELIHAVSKGEGLNGVKGIAYRNGNDIVVNPAGEFILDLDVLPFPKIKYTSPNKMMAVISGRGCYGKCIYCASSSFSSSMKGRFYRKRSVENVLDEIQEYINCYGTKYIAFNDDTFLGNTKEWLMNFVMLIKKRKMKFEFFAFGRANDLIRNAECLEPLKEVGLRAVFVGIESFVERQLLFFNKKVTPQENEKALKLLNNNGIQYNIGMILYDPLATMEEIDVNINMLIQLEYFNNIFETSAAISLLSPLRPVSGSVFEDYLLKNGIYSTDKEYGYEFKDNRVNEYYTFICDRWLPRIEAVRKKYINGEMTDSDFIAWKKVVEYDLCFLQESINAFINNKCYVESILERWSKKVEEVNFGEGSGKGMVC